MNANLRRAKILVVDLMDEEVLAGLKKRFSVTVKMGLTKDELIKEVPPYDAIIGRTTTKLDADIIRAATNLRCIGVHATGWNHIDVEEATKRDVAVLGFPSDKKHFKEDRLRGSFIAAAEHVILSMLACAGDYYSTVASMKAGRWEKYGFSGTELYGKTLGIVGLGRIGSLVADRAKAFGMKVVAYHPRITKAEAKRRSAELVPLRTLCKQADFITLHMPQTKETTNMFDKNVFKLMKKGAILINTSRAGVVVEQDLIKALTDGTLRAAAIDVFEHPPKGVNPKLVRLPNVLPTPHIAGVSQESLKRVSTYIGTSVADYLTRGKMRGLINMKMKRARS